MWKVLAAPNFAKNFLGCGGETKLQALEQENEMERDAQESSPLDINCEDALSFVEDWLRARYSAEAGQMQEFSKIENSAFLDRVAEMMLLPELTDCVATAFLPLLPDLVGRWTALEDTWREKIACAMGKLIHFEPKLQRYPRHISR
jgi:hypothetical protein